MVTAAPTDFFSGILQQIIAGLVLAALLAVTAFSKIRKWLKRKRTPPAPTNKIPLLLAKLDGDTANSTRESVQECIEREFGGNVAVLRWDDSLSFGDGYHEAAE